MELADGRQGWSWVVARGDAGGHSQAHCVRAPSVTLADPSV